MKRWKRGAAMLLCLCMTAALLAGCGRGRSGESTASVVMTGGVSTVDPAYAATPAERTLVLHLFDNLYRWTAEGAVPAAAHAYDCTDNEDGTQTYTFHLRRDGKWSDGSDVTAEDFVYAWRRLVDPETNSPNVDALAMVAGYDKAVLGDTEALQVSAPDDHTLVVVLSGSYPSFIESTCTSAVTMPVQEKAVTGHDNWSVSSLWFVGNGAYERTGDWSDSTRLTLHTRAAYYDVKRLGPDRIDIQLKDRQAADASAGKVDIVIGAGGEDAQQGGDESGKTYKVAIIKQLDHASLDEIANAVAAELDKIAADNNVTIEYDITSGQNDQTILKQLSDQAIADQVDAIIPIATTAAQISALSAEDTKTPVVYAAVSDPEAASLTGIDYVTGTSDALNTSFIMDMMFAQNPDVAKVGLLYSLSEPNSTKPIADAKAYLDTKGIEYVEQTANTNDEVVAAASALIADGVDAVFTPTDNVIMAAELAIYEDLAKAGIPHYTGADSFVRNGAYVTCGVNYTDLGAKTADLAYSAITDGMDAMEDYYLMDGGIITVNTDTAAAMSLDYSCFDSMGTVVEVTTTKD